MKKLLNLISIFAMVAIMTNFMSCGDNDDDNNDDDNVPMPPTLTFTYPQISHPNQDVSIGDSFSFIFSAESNVTSNAALSKVMITMHFSSGEDSTMLDKTVSGTSDNTTYKYGVPKSLNDGDSINVTITVTDVNSESASQKFVLNVIDLIKMNTFNVTLYAQGNDTGNFFIAATGQTIGKYQGKQNSSKIDLVYCFHSLQAASIASPTNSWFESAGDISDLKVFEWSAKRVTELRKMNFGTSNAVMDLVWDKEVTKFDEVETKYNGGSDIVDIIYPLVGGSGIRSYIGFKTEDGLFGIIKVLTVYGGSMATNYIDLEIKVQKPQ